MNFSPGYYKIEKGGSQFDISYHYMVVYFVRGTKYIKVDNNEPQPASKCEEWIRDNYRLVKPITAKKPIQVKNPVITIRWTDEDGHLFQWDVDSFPSLVKLMKFYKRVASALKFTKE